MMLHYHSVFNAVLRLCLQLPDHPATNIVCGVGSFFSGGWRGGAHGTGPVHTNNHHHHELQLPEVAAASVVADGEGDLQFLADPLHPPYPLGEDLKVQD